MAYVWVCRDCIGVSGENMVICMCVYIGLCRGFSREQRGVEKGSRVYRLCRDVYGVGIWVG